MYAMVLQYVCYQQKTIGRPQLKLLLPLISDEYWYGMPFIICNCCQLKLSNMQFSIFFLNTIYTFTCISKMALIRAFTLQHQDINDACLARPVTCVTSLRKSVSLPLCTAKLCWLNRTEIKCHVIHSLTVHTSLRQSMMSCQTCYDSDSNTSKSGAWELQKRTSCI